MIGFILGFFIFALISVGIVTSIQSRFGYAKIEGFYIDGIDDISPGLHINVSFTPKNIILADLELPMERVEGIEIVSNTCLSTEQAEILRNTKASDLVLVIHYVNKERATKKCFIVLKRASERLSVQNIINNINSKTGFREEKTLRQI